MASIQALARENSKLKCSYTGCENRRYQRARYCWKHHLRVRVYGHVEGRRLPLHLFSDCIEEVRELLCLNPDHEGLAVVKDWFRTRIDLAQSRATNFEFDPIFHLMECRRPLQHTIARIGGLYLFEKRDFEGAKRYFLHEKMLFANITQLLIGRGLDYKSIGAKRPANYHYHYLGRQIHDGLGVFFLTLAKSVDLWKEMRKESANTLATPFKYDPDNYKPDSLIPPYKSNSNKRIVWLLDPISKGYFKMADLARLYHHKPGTLRGRLAQGWDLERALLQPTKKYTYSNPEKKKKKASALAKGPSTI